MPQRCSGFQDYFVSIYRFHILDPIYFQSDIKVKIQQLGSADNLGENWRELFASVKEKYGWSDMYVHPNMSDNIYERSDDYCSTVYWYQEVMNKPLPKLPCREERIVGIGMEKWEKGDV